MAFLSFYWLFDAVSLFTFWWASEVCPLSQEPARGHRCGWPHLYRAILVKIITSSRALSCPTSPAPHHGQCLLAGPVDAEEVAGVEIVLLWAVPNVSAVLACWAQRSRESLGRTPSRSGRRWEALAGRRRRWWAAWRGLGGGAGRAASSRSSSSVLAVMQRQVPAVLLMEVPQIQFIDSGWTFLL